MYDTMGSYTPGFVLSGCLALLSSGMLSIDVCLKKTSISDNYLTEKQVDCNTDMTQKAAAARVSEYGQLNVYFFETYV
jgi:hypothetical protein